MTDEENNETENMTGSETKPDSNDEAPKLPEDGAPPLPDDDAPPPLPEMSKPSNPYDPNYDDFDDLPHIEYVDEPRNLVSRGDEINITKKDPTMQEIMIGVGWDLKKFDSAPLDLDASVFLLDRHDKTREDSDFVFYNNLTGCDGAVKHMGDSRTGAGDGDDENILINLLGLPFDVAKISFVLSIYDMEMKDHNFSMVKNVYFRIVNQNTQHELFRYELDEELVGNEGLIIGTLERVGTEWIFLAIGDTVKGGLGKIAADHAIIVAQIVQD
jgi:tellurium resistance protein TerD